MALDRQHCILIGKLWDVSVLDYLLNRHNTLYRTDILIIRNTVLVPQSVIDKPTFSSPAANPNSIYVATDAIWKKEQPGSTEPAAVEYILWYLHSTAKHR